MPTKIQLRRDTAADWTSNNPTLAAGEFGWESDTNRFKIGDGATAWTSLGYASDGDTAGITFVGDDSTGTLVSQNETFKIAGGTGITTAVSGDTLTITASGGGGATGLTFVGDDSTGTLIGDGETVKIAGGTGITTAMSGDTLTITGPDLSSYITNSPITVVGDDSTGTVFNTGETIKIAGGTGITTAMSGDTLTITASGGGGGTITALNNQAENRLVTIGSTTTELDGEANLTFDGSTLTLTGTAALDGVTITDNTISTNASNANLEITANGTGRVMISANDSRGDNNILIASDNPKNVMIYEDANAVFGQYNYANYIKGYYKIDSGQSNSTSSSDRYRNVLETELDLNGKSSTSTSTSISRGPMGSNSLVRIRNTGGTDVTLGNANGGQNGLTVYANTTNNITVTEAAGHSSFVEGNTSSGLTADFTEAHGYYSQGLIQGGSGTTSATTFTHFHAVPSAGTVTNEYAFYAEDAGMNNLIGGVTLQNGAINTDGISIVDNEITTTRSNDPLWISANGTGYISLGPDFDTVNTNTRYNYGATRVWNGTTSGTNRIHLNSDGGIVTVTGALSGSANVRQEVRNVLDMNGYNSTATNAVKARGLNVMAYNGFIKNSAATASTVEESSAFVPQITAEATGGDITVTHLISVNAGLLQLAQTGLTSTITNGYGVYSNGITDDGGAGTKATTNYYHFFAAGSAGITPTNHYAFYDNANLLSRFGAVILANQAGDPSTVTDSAHIYAKDDAGSSEVYVRDEAGNVTKISPHNSAGEWEYYSVNRNTGKTVRINMEALVREVEQLSGKKFIEKE